MILLESFHYGTDYWLLFTGCLSLKAAVSLETHTHNHQQHVDNLGIKLISVPESESLHCKLGCHQSHIALIPTGLLSFFSANQQQSIPTRMVSEYNHSFATHLDEIRALEDSL